MTSIASRTSGVVPTRRRLRGLGLSGRLLLLTMSFVMIVQVLVYVPSAVSFVRSWISDRVMAAQMVALTLSTTPDGSRAPELDRRLMSGMSDAGAVGVRGHGTRWLLGTGGAEPPAANRVVDLRQPSWPRAVQAVFRLLLTRSNDTILFKAQGAAGVPEADAVELLVTEEPLRQALVHFTRNFLVMTLLVSAGTGALLYLALHLLVVRPVRRLSTNIADFAADPEDSGRVIRPTGREDEIGRAEEALARMETALAGELRSKRRLADLGLAVSKINHELRNILTTAQLLGDRLSGVEDPTVRRVVPRLVRTLARATEYCGATLAYGRASEAVPRRVLVPVKPLVEELLDLSALADGVPVTIRAAVPDDLVVDADPEQIGRVLLNLIRNAVEAHARSRTADATVTISGRRIDGAVLIRVVDNGPGVPDRVRDRLFSAFQASERSGGTGLGLPVAAEIVRLHGGTIVLEKSDGGASFLLTVPDQRKQA